jgi:hypothetical protein
MTSTSENIELFGKRYHQRSDNATAGWQGSGEKNCCRTHPFATCFNASLILAESITELEKKCYGFLSSLLSLQ